MKKIFLLSIVALLFQVSAYSSDYAQVRHVTTSNNDASVINELVSSISSQLTKNKNFKNLQESAIAITSFVSLDNLKATSRLSNILSENLIHEMQVRGYKVIDFKTMEKIKIDSRGDFLFSRDVAKLRSELNIDYALTGTYVKYRSGTVVNARIIDLKTHIVLSSAQVLIPTRVVKRVSSIKSEIPSLNSKGDI